MYYFQHLNGPNQCLCDVGASWSIYLDYVIEIVVGCEQQTIYEIWASVLVSILLVCFWALIS